MIIFLILPFLFINITNYKALNIPTKLEQSSSISGFTDQLQIKWEKLLETYSIPGSAISINLFPSVVVIFFSLLFFCKNSANWSDNSNSTLVPFFISKVKVHSLVTVIDLNK